MPLKELVMTEPAQIDRVEIPDLLVVGGGIVGLAAAWQLAVRWEGSGRKITLLEKEPGLAAHQTGRNSGVLHTGIYYRPETLRAQLCRQGKLELETFCEQEKIACQRCGKVIVAVTESELPKLEQIWKRGQANGVSCRQLDQQQLREIEPHTAGIAGIHVPEAGIIDYPAVCRRLAKKLTERGHSVRLGVRVDAVHNVSDGILAQTDQGEIRAQSAVLCGGLQSDRLARASGLRSTTQIVPFRGEYFRLRPDAEPFCRGLIYPVPDPSLPFLGVHFTRMANGGVDCGPNAVLALAREGYGKFSFNARDTWETLTNRGFLRMAVRHWRTGCHELWRSWSKPAFVKALQRLIPAIRADHLEPAPSGIRAQAILPTGELADDFLLETAGRVIHVLNAPSPAATAALAIGRHIAERVDGI